MQLTLAAAAAATLMAVASAYDAGASEYNLNSTYKEGRPYAKIVNRCDYDVNLWSIEKQMGCPTGKGVTLSKGQFYWEELRNSTSADQGGISIKISKFESCGGNDLTQLEYKLSWESGYEGNYLDMSFVDCKGLNCPGRTDGFYFKVGNQKGNQKSAVNNEHCPVFSVNDASEAAAVSYINPDDRQTKFCTTEASVELYLCGGHEPGSDDYTPAPSSSSETKPSHANGHHQEQPSVTSNPLTEPEVAAAAVTKAPTTPNVKTEVVYKTVYVKRHAHGRRHQQFHA